MSPAEDPSAIRFVCTREDAYPREASSEIKDDVYVLSSPLCRGRARIECDGSLLYDGEVRPGMVRLASPGERIRTVVNSPSQAAVLSFPGPQLRQILDTQDHNHRRGRVSLIDPLVKPDYQVSRLCATLLSATEFDSSQRQLFIDGIAHALLACLLKNHCCQPSLRRPRSSQGLSDAELERCLEYADSMVAEGLDLNTWAGTIGMTPAEFMRRFRRKTRQAPYAWFLNWRIDRAKQILQDPALPVSEIALRVGFCSQSHFTEAFRRRTGCSPGRWRSQNTASRIR